MNLSHRTEASSLFEKGTDPELVMPVFLEGMKLMKELTGGTSASAVCDIYPAPYAPSTVRVHRKTVDGYMGTHLETKEIKDILTKLGCRVEVDESDIAVHPPSYRRDITIGVDVIEELARIYGYHVIKGVLPEKEPPMTFEEPVLGWEQKLKTKLSDWGYTETYTYSMISQDMLDIFGIPEQETYRITNALSEDLVFMRPTLLPGMLLSIKQNLPHEQDIRLFELSMIYAYRKGNLPIEQSTLIVAVSGSRYRKIKGIAEAIFSLFGIDLPHTTDPASSQYQSSRSLLLGNFGQLGEIDPTLLAKLSIAKPVTVLELSLDQLVRHARTIKHYVPIPKYPSSYEDLAFIVPEKSPVAPMISYLTTIDPLIRDASLFDSYKNIRTFHIIYQSDTKNLTSDDISKVREKIIKRMKNEFYATLKTV